MIRNGSRGVGGVLLRFGLSVVGWLAVNASVCAQEIPSEVLAWADLVLYNGKVLTVDEKFTVASAIASRDGKILAVGDSANILKMAGPKTEKIDLGGKSVIPGFVVTHAGAGVGGGTEVAGVALSGGACDNCGPGMGGFDDLDGFFRMLKPIVEAAKPGEWVIVKGRRVPAIIYGLNTSNLDSIAPNNPVKVEFDTSWSIVNSKALSYFPDLNIPGVIKDKDGKPTGTLRTWANGVLSYEVVPWPKDIEPSVQRAKKSLESHWKFGVTTIGGRNSGLAVTIVHSLWLKEGKKLPIRVNISHEFPMFNPNAEAFYKRMGNFMGLGDDWFRITGTTVGPVDGVGEFGGIMSINPKLKTVPTGSFGLYGENKFAWTQSQKEAEGQQGYNPFGDQSWKETSDYKNIILAAKYGWNATDMHTIGDAAIEIFLEAMERAQKEGASVEGLRFGNAHSEWRREDQMARMAQYGMVASVRPNILWRRPGFYKGHAGYEALATQYGPDAVQTMIPVKTLTTLGVKVALEGQGIGEQDPAFPDSYPALLQLFVTRKNWHDGKLIAAHEAVGRDTALRTATINAAYMYFFEDKVGSLEPGKLADMLILSGDYMTVPADQIGKLEVLTTIVGGKVVYQKP